ncbi:hypothetical protein B0H17DRAFT_939352, partial [Mycena rosella]
TISVEHLFSSVKHSLSDARSSMTAEMASVDIVTKEWLKSGLGKGINYTIPSITRVPVGGGASLKKRRKTSASMGNRLNSLSAAS